MTINDENSGFSSMRYHSFDSTYDIGNYKNSDLGEFLSRPIRIATTTWSVGSNLNQSYDPWHLFLTDDAVSRRTDNFRLLRGNLVVKAVINATPFHYGRALMHYQPWPTYDTVSAPVLGDQNSIVCYSQRPKVFLNPTTCEGGEMKLPFFHPSNWFDLQSATAGTEMGALTLTSFDILKHANAGTDDVTISIFAWMTDVSMCVPTTQLSAQSKPKRKKRSRYNMSHQNKVPSEYSDDGPISKVATTVAQVAGSLESVPALAPFAFATRIGASAVSGIAKIFGFSRPPILDNTLFYKPSFTGNMAATDTHETVHKLTIDSKQELTVDPRTVGLDGTDELSILYLAQKETFLTAFDWSTIQAVDTLLWNTQVSPMLEHKQTSIIYYPTSLSFVTKPFEYWSGSIIFRFQIVRSAYHKGRLAIQWDPNTAVNIGGEFNKTYTTIIDIGEEDDFEICVPWADANPYLETDALITPFGTTPVLTNARRTNGVLTVSVLNELTAPAPTSDISVNVFISAGDDYEVKAPKDLPGDLKYNYLVPQSTFELTPQSTPEESTPAVPQDANENNPEETVTKHFMGEPDISAFNMKSQVFFGESIVSLRTLMRRYNYQRTWVMPPGTTGARVRKELVLGAKPLQPGYYGPDSTAGGIDYSYCNMTMINYVMPAFVGYRGAFRHKFFINSNTATKASAARSRDVPLTTAVYNIEAAGTSVSDVAYSSLVTSSLSAGATVTPLDTQPVLEVEFPYQIPFRFSMCRNTTSTGTLAFNDFNATKTVQFDAIGEGLTAYDTIDDYVAIGEDFNLFFFLNAPPYALQTTAVP